MYQAGAVNPESFEMSLGSVSLMLRETVLGIFAVVFNHEAVAGHLRDDRGGGDRHRKRVAALNAPARRLYDDLHSAVDHDVIRDDAEVGYR